MNWKKIGRALLFPHIAIMILLIPIATALLVWSMVVIGTESAVAYVSYVLAAYTLTIWCFKIPKMIKNFKAFKNNNKYARKWQDDTRFRVKMTLFGSLLWNAAYGVFQLGLGIHHNTFWYFSFGIYYLCLAIMRLFLAWHVKKHAPGEKIRLELIKYRTCGWVFLVMTLALALIIFFMLYWNRTFTHDMITTIAMAAYTFMSFTMAIINVVKYKKYNSPVLSASKAISFAAACVSMVTLTSTMLTVFSDGTMNIFTQKLMIGGVGTAVWLIVVAMAIIMIKRGNKNYTNEVKNEQ